MGILEIIAVILVVVWLGGFLLDIAGGIIHILLLAAVALFALRFFRKAF